MKILNLYAGIGGNRKLWGDEHEIVAVEIEPEIAKVYQDFFPNDVVVLADAHEYLLKHFGDFDFIWSSPPCPTHSRINTSNTLYPHKDNKEVLANGGYWKPRYADMKLYEEIILLKQFYKGKWVIENVIPYYEPLIPATEIQRHLFWSNFLLRDLQIDEDSIAKGTISYWEERSDVDLSKYKGLDKRKILRNYVHPLIGKHILELAINPIELHGSIFTPLT